MLQEFTGSFHHPRQLQLASGCQKGLHISLSHFNGGGVAVVYQLTEDWTWHISDDDNSLTTFIHRASEHGTKEGAGSRQDNAVGFELVAVGLQRDIRQRLR
jgi:maltooligosyltrehalose synthase